MVSESQASCPIIKDLKLGHYILLQQSRINNPQANSILERNHQVLGNILRTKNLQKYDFDDMDPWSELLGSVAWAIHSTHHITLQTTPGHLVFGKDILLNLKFVADWEAIKLRKQRDVDMNNSKENSLRIHHDYQIVIKYSSQVMTFTED